MGDWSEMEDYYAELESQADSSDLKAFDLVEEQPAPTPSESRPIWELVVQDMQERDQVGRQRYGTPLQAGNGRDALVDAYQEALDLAVYLRQAIEERDPSYRLSKSEPVLCQLCGQETVFGKFGPACPCCDFDNGIFCNHRSEAVCG